MLEFGSGRFQLSLAETIAWCKMQSIGTEADSDGVHQRHLLYLQAKQLWEEARLAANQGSFPRKISDTEPWRHSAELYKQIRDSLPPMDRTLRSSELKPTFDLNDVKTNPQWSEVVGEVAAKRAQSIGGDWVAKADANAAGGRLLAYYPHENLACGAARYSSGGFFDDNNVPPWDLWVEFSEDTLVSWVPPALVDVAQMGIEVNPEECIHWAT
jgi:hypothetical protein